MNRAILLYGLLGGVLIAALKLIEYRWLIVEHSIEIYGGLVAALFAGLGIWLGRKLVRPPTAEPIAAEPIAAEPTAAEPAATPPIPSEAVAAPAAFAFLRDDARLAGLGITPRELQVLELIAEGLSNREIGERVHVSENTVKTHSSRVMAKLGARRRTQAVQRAKELRLIA